MMKKNLSQKLVNTLISKYDFPKSSIIINPKFTFEDKILVPDIVVYGEDKHNKLPLLVAEIRQNLQYPNEAELLLYLEATGASYGILYDGTRIFFYKKISPRSFVDIPDIPKKGIGAVLFNKEDI